MSALLIVSPPRAGHVVQGRSRSGPTLAAAVLGFFVTTLDAVVVNVALPSIRDDLGGGITGLQWVVDGYTLMFAALLLTAGALSDRVGARRAFAAGLSVFVVASAACGLAPSLAELVVGRFTQGAAAAVLMPSSMALIRQAYADPTVRARAVAVWAMGGAVASSSGPLLGGLLTLASWRMVFAINLPVGAVALGLLAWTERSPHRKVPFDWVGQLTAVLAMGALTYGVIQAGADGFTAPRVVAAFAVTVVALAAFLTAQARGAHPMVPLELFRSGTVPVAVAVGFAFVAGYYGLPFVMSLYLQQLRGLSSLATGALAAAVAVTAVAGVIPMPWSHGQMSSAAYAVTRNADGTVEVTVRWNQLHHPDALNARLRQAGVRAAVLLYSAPGACRTPVVADPAHSTLRLDMRQHPELANDPRALAAYLRSLTPWIDHARQSGERDGVAVFTIHPDAIPSVTSC